MAESIGESHDYGGDGSLPDAPSEALLSHTFLPGFYLDHEALFHQIRDSTLWDERMRVRKTASYGIPYNYGSMRYEDYPPMPSHLENICDEILSTFGFRPNNCLLNYYPDGDSSIGFHSDSAQRLAPGTGVVIVSLGCSRTMVFKKKADRTNQHHLELLPGSLLYVPTAMQEYWLHGIPKSEVTCGSRISLTFRLILPQQTDYESTDGTEKESR